MNLDDYIFAEADDYIGGTKFSISLFKTEIENRNTQDATFETYLDSYEKVVQIYGLISYRNKHKELGNSENDNSMEALEKTAREVILGFRKFVLSHILGNSGGKSK